MLSVLVGTSLYLRFLDWLISFDSIWPGFVGVSLFVVILAMFISQLTDQAALRKLAQGKPFIICVMFATLAAGIFGGSSCFLQRMDWFSVLPAIDHTQQCTFEYSEIYLWHLLDSVPILKIPEILEWELKYQLGSAAKTMVIIFKVTIVVTVLRAYTRLYELKRE